MATNKPTKSNQPTFVTGPQNVSQLLDTEIKYECEIRGITTQSIDDPLIDVINQQMHEEEKPWNIPYQVNVHGQRLDFGVCKLKIEELDRRLKTNLAKATEIDEQRLLHYFYRLWRLNKALVKPDERIEFDKLLNVVKRLYSSVKEVCNEIRNRGNAIPPTQRSPIHESTNEDFAHSTEIGAGLHHTIDIADEGDDETIQQRQVDPNLDQTINEANFIAETGNITADLNHLLVGDAPLTPELQQFVNNVNQNDNTIQTSTQQLPPNTVEQLISVTSPVNTTTPTNPVITPSIITSSLPNTVSSSIEQPSNLIGPSTTITSNTTTTTTTGTKPKTTQRPTNFQSPSDHIQKSVSFAPNLNQTSPSFLNQPRVYTEDAVKDLVSRAQQQTNNQFQEELKKIHHNVRLMQTEREKIEKQYQDKIKQLEANAKQNTYQVNTQPTSEHYPVQDDYENYGEPPFQIQRTNVHHDISRINSPRVNQNLGVNQTAYYQSNGTGVNSISERVNPLHEQRQNLIGNQNLNQRPNTLRPTSTDATNNVNYHVNNNTGTNTQNQSEIGQLTQTINGFVRALAEETMNRTQNQQSANRKWTYQQYNIFTNTCKFYGNPNDDESKLMQYLSALELFRHTQNVTERALLQNLTATLHGNAAQWYQSRYDQFTSLAEFTRAVKERFGIKLSKGEIITQLHNTRFVQGNSLIQHIDDLIYKIRAHKLDMSEYKQCETILSTLPSNIKTTFLLAGVVNVEQLVRKCQQLYPRQPKLNGNPSMNKPNYQSTNTSNNRNNQFNSNYQNQRFTNGNRQVNELGVENTEPDSFQGTNGIINEEHHYVDQQNVYSPDNELEPDNDVNAVQHNNNLRYSNRNNQQQGRNFPQNGNSNSNNSSNNGLLEQLQQLINQNSGQRQNIVCFVCKQNGVTFWNCNTPSCLEKKRDGPKNSNSSLSQERAQTQ